MLRLVIQTKRKYKKQIEKKRPWRKKTENDEEPTTDEKAEKNEYSRNSEGETEGISSKTDCDQDSEVSFVGDTDEDIDTAEIEEHWIEDLKRSTNDTSWRKNEDTQYPVLDHDTQKDEMEIGNADLFWTRDKMVKKRQQNGIQGLSSGCKASRAVGRPRKRWEDTINQFFKLEETKETKGNDLKSNDTWMQVAKDQIRLKEMEKITSGTSQKGVEVYRDGRYTSEWGQLVFTPVQKRTITSAASDDLVSDAIRVAADIWSVGKTFDEYTPSPQSCSRLWAWWAQTVM